MPVLLCIFLMLPVSPCHPHIFFFLLCYISEYLTVGISSVKRIKGNYLHATLQSLFSHSSPVERSSMVVVVLLADFDNNWRVTTVKEIKNAFASELEQGQLLVIHVSKQWYPRLTGTVHVFLLVYNFLLMS